MLHEILLSLAGNPSPLLRPEPPGADAGRSPTANSGGDGGVFSPPERELLASAARLSDLHVKLLGYTAQISSSHPSVICRAVAASVASVHLAAFQRKVLEVEDQVLRRDAGLVGAYNIVPLTAVVGEFSDWTRRMEWLWEMVELMVETGSGSGSGDSKQQPPSRPCSGADIINRLRTEMQTGYVDIEATAASLVAVAETAWLKQVSTWILYGRLPSFGAGDFFVQRSASGDEEFICNADLLPSFVTPSTASSMLFIGSSLSYIRGKSAELSAATAATASGFHGLDHLSSQLSELSQLTYPLDGAVFARTITKIRLFLSKNILQKFLPLSKVVDILQVLRDFFLLGRGEFAMALTQQADEKVSSRWQRADNLAYEKRDGLGSVMVKEGEVVAVLAKTWGALGSLQGQHSEEDEGLERARDLLRLGLVKTKNAPSSFSDGGMGIATAPFRNLLFGVPVVLTLQVPSPLDLFLSPSDLQTYATINAYLLSIRRAHIKLTDLWKISSLRRHHPPPPRPPYGSTPRGRERVRQLRTRLAERSNAMRSAWATSSAAIFFLAESGAYLQTEVVAGLWDGYQQWLLAGSGGQPEQGTPPVAGAQTDVEMKDEVDDDEDGDVAPAAEEEDDDIWLAAASSRDEPMSSSSEPVAVVDDADDGTDNDDSGGGDDDLHPASSSSPSSPQCQPHDPQTLSAAHRLLLRTLTRRLLLTNAPDFTRALYDLLADADALVGKVHRLCDIWDAMDLEEDSGVIDAFTDLEGEEVGVKMDLRAVEGRVKGGIEACVGELRVLEGGGELDAVEGDVGKGRGGSGGEGSGAEAEVETLREEGEYVPRRVGGLDRLLMKLDFGTWFESGARAGEFNDEDVL